MAKWLGRLGVCAALLGACMAQQSQRAYSSAPALSAQTGEYVVTLATKTGQITIGRKGKQAALSLKEVGRSKALDLLFGTRKARHVANGWDISGSTRWGSFAVHLTFVPSVPGLLHVRVSVNPKRDAPSARPSPDVQLVHAAQSTLHLYAPATPVAGSSLFLSDSALDSTILYFADYTSLGQYFDRTNSGAGQANFTYPRAGNNGSLVGVSGSTFGYVPPPSSLGNLPHHKSTPIVDSYLYLLPGVPQGEAAAADTYLKMTDTVLALLPTPSIPTPDWQSLAAASATDLADPANLVTVGTHRYLRSYVSDTRSAPELITQATVLAAMRAYEQRYHTTIPLDATLSQDLPDFYDPAYHTVVNGLSHDPTATGESWYFVTNMIALLQLAQLGDETARKLLLDSVDALISLAHINGYEFPQSFAYRDFNGQGSGVQPDVAGGYAWLMLGLNDLTGQARFLQEAEASIPHIAGRGFDLSYETHMTAYSAAAAQRLYKMTNTAAYHDDALIALSNLFHATRLWDCTYRNCRKGSGYHTYMGINPLPWSDYIAMLEQYQAWLGLHDYMTYAAGEPGYVTDLVQAFLTYSPRTLRYSLPTQLPAGVASPTAGEYQFVPRNNLSWNIPLEDLREGESISGTIGQEIYGGGGPFAFAAYGP